jgi:hypothetical protein
MHAFHRLNRAHQLLADPRQHFVAIVVVIARFLYFDREGWWYLFLVFIKIVLLNILKQSTQ